MLSEAGKIQLTVLVENSVAFPFAPDSVPGVLGEHGLAVLIDNGEEQVLYDTGRGRTLVGNLAQCGFNIENINKVVISHGHLDHTGSLKSFLQERKKKTEVYCHEGIFKDRYGKRDEKYNRIGIPFTRSDLVEAGAIFRPVSAVQEVGRGILVSGPIPRAHRWEENRGNFFVRDGEQFVPDDFEDDMAVFIDVGAAPAVLTGCGHAGVINTLEYALKIFGSKRIPALIGGLHMEGVPPDRAGLTIRHLGNFVIDRLIVGHCTGFGFMCSLRQEFGDKVTPLTAGRQIRL